MPAYKFKLTDERHDVVLPDGRDARLYRIQAVRDIPELHVSEGDFGGWVESEANLSQEGLCWIANNAVVAGAAHVMDDALVKDHAFVFGDGVVIADKAIISGHACVTGRAVVQECAKVKRHAWVSGAAHIAGHAIIDDNACVRDGACIVDRAIIDSNATVGGKVKVFGHANITGSAKVEGMARIGDHAAVGDDARVLDKAALFGSARITGMATVGGEARIEGEAHIYENAIVVGYAYVGDRAKVKGDAIINGLDTTVIITGSARIDGSAYITSKDHFMAIKPPGSSLLSIYPEIRYGSRIAADLVVSSEAGHEALSELQYTIEKRIEDLRKSGLRTESNQNMERNFRLMHGIVPLVQQYFDPVLAKLNEIFKERDEVNELRNRLG